jgi:hypothetical protein
MGAVSVGRLVYCTNDDKGAWMLSYTEDASGSQLTGCVEVVIPLLDAVVTSWSELAEMFDMETLGSNIGLDKVYRCYKLVQHYHDARNGKCTNRLWSDVLMIFSVSSHKYGNIGSQ